MKQPIAIGRMRVAQMLGLVMVAIVIYLLQPVIARERAEADRQRQDQAATEDAIANAQRAAELHR